VKKTQIRPNGDSRRSCACCNINCDFVTMGAKNQSILQDWLDRGQGNRFATTSGSSFATRTSKPVPNAGIGLSQFNITDSSTTSSVQSASSVDAFLMKYKPATTDMLTQSPYDHPLDVDAITDAMSRSSSATSSNFDANQRNTGHIKRSRDDAETTETASGRFTKAARVEVTDNANIANLARHEPGLGLAHHILGLLAWLETVPEKEKASEVAMKDVLERCERQRATIKSMQIKEASLEEIFCKLQGQRDTTDRVAVDTTAKVRELEAECIQLISDTEAYKEEMDTLRGQLEQGVEKVRQAGEAVIRLEDKREADRLAIADLESQVGEISELRRQHEAASKNADESRKQRNELQITLTTSKAENVRLSEQLTTSTTEYDTATIELDEYRAGFKKLQAVSAELDTTKADLAILRSEYQRVAADNARLLHENGSMEEIKAKSRINQRLADDRLEERQEKEAELRQAKAESKQLEERAKKADGKTEEIRKNWHNAKNELLDLHRRNKKLKVELKKHANCPGGDMVKQESRI
jgi:chromosome segregation ATPase